ncbi:uncharacterized protein LOC131207430 [Anopheles bellator]|uniref:uncharacterized protein LOC131207430 n=1 Tax=Anopheles bellator TaxID=139047 RepID=UPI002647FE44|nr:uncharacterized protein LOC131207430 [Anopheles bellator]
MATVRCNTPSFLIYEQLVTGYLKGHQLITTIIGSEMTDNVLMEAMQCEYNRLVLSSYKLYTVDTYLKLVESDRADRTYGLNNNPYSFWEAFHCEANLSATVDHLLPAIAFRNPMTKVILLIRKIAKYDMLQIFHVAWFKYRLLNVLILSRVDPDTLMVCLFNPYLTEPSVLDDRNMFCHRLSTIDEVAAFNRDVDQFTRERIRNLHLYPLRIAITDVDLMSKAVRYGNGTIRRYEYLDGEMVEIMRERLNFSVQFVELSYQESVGFVTSNGSLGGTLQMLEQNSIDLAANSRSTIEYPMRNLHYVHFLCPLRLVFVVPNNYYANRFKVVFFHTFSIQMFIFDFGISLALPFLLLVVMRSRLSVAAYAEEVFRTLAIALATTVSMPRGLRPRLVLMGLMFYSIVAYSAWQGVTIIRLNMDDEKLHNINTLKELLESDLELQAILSFGNAIWSKNWSTKDVRGKLAARLNVQANPSSQSLLPLVADNRTSASLIIEYFTDVVKSRYFNTERKQSKVHIVPQYFIEYMTAMAIPKNSPLLPSVTGLTMGCLENGIVNHQLALIRIKGMLLHIARNRNKTLSFEAETRKVTLNNMRIVFSAYVAMNGVAILVFIYEICKYRYVRQKWRRARQRVRQRTVMWPYVR